MIRQPAVEGAFYPADPELLRSVVSSFINDSGIAANPHTAGVVSPHAGYVFSGPVAGYSFAAAPDEIDTVIVIAPSHSYPVYGASVYSGEGYRTPLGVCGTDTGTVGKLLDLGMTFDPMAHKREHSAEVQIPFIQVRWPEARIVVIVQGLASLSFCSELAEKIREATAGTGRNLLVASSDLSHYHPLSKAMELDGNVIDAFVSGSTDKLHSVLSSREGEACGGGPMLTLLSWAAASGCVDFDRLFYDTSATASGDSGAVVGYFAGVVRKKG